MGRLENMDDLRTFTCPAHSFVTVATSDGEVSCRGTPGRRDPGCATCDQVVDDAFRYATTTTSEVGER